MSKLVSSITNEAAVARQSGAMEEDTISKHGRNSKSQTSRGNFFKFVSAIFVVCLIFTLPGCDEEKEEFFTVIFDCKGGSDVPKQTVKKGGKLAEPQKPIRDNYDFAGWATANNETSSLWNFDIGTVEEDMTLYAKWIEEGDDNGGLTVSGRVENASKYSEIVKVKAMLWDSNTEEEIEIAEAEFKKDGSFSITLPATIDTRYLSGWDDEDIPPALVVSDKSAKSTYLDIAGVDEAGNIRTWLYYGKLMESGAGVYVDYIYSDSNFSITGTHTETEELNVYNYVYALHIKKGWNITYETLSIANGGDGTYIRNRTYTSTPISGLKWYGNQDWDW